MAQQLTAEQVDAAISQAGNGARQQSGLRVVGAELPQTSGGGTISPVKPLVADTSVESYNSYMGDQQATKNLYDQWGREMDKVANTNMQATSLLGQSGDALSRGMSGLQAAILNAGTKYDQQKKVADAEAKRVKDEQDQLNVYQGATEHFDKLEMSTDNTTLDTYDKAAESWAVQYAKDNNINPLVLKDTLVRLHDEYIMKQRGFMAVQQQEVKKSQELAVVKAFKDIQITHAGELSELKEAGTSDIRAAQIRANVQTDIDNQVQQGGMTPTQALALTVEVWGDVAANTGAGSDARVRNSEVLRQATDFQAEAEKLRQTLPPNELGAAILALRGHYPFLSAGTPTYAQANADYARQSLTDTKVAAEMVSSNEDPNAVQKVKEYAIAKFVDRGYRVGFATAMTELDALPDGTPGKAEAMSILRNRQALGNKAQLLDNAITTVTNKLAAIRQDASLVDQGKFPTSNPPNNYDINVAKATVQKQFTAAQDELKKLQIEREQALQGIPEGYRSASETADKMRGLQTFIQKVQLRTPQSGF